MSLSSRSFRRFLARIIPIGTLAAPHAAAPLSDALHRVLAAGRVLPAIILDQNFSFKSERSITH